MSDVPRQTLCHLIATYGTALCDDARRCENLLRDLCGTYRREIHVLISALKEGVAADLLAAYDNVPQELLLQWLARRLYDNLGLAMEFARWGVESWALALGQLTAAACAAPPGEAVSVTGAAALRAFSALSLVELVERLSQAVGTVMANGANAQQVQTESPDVGRLSSSPPSTARRPTVKVKGVHATLTRAVSQVLVVAQHGQGQYSSLAEAVRNAPPGARLVVRPGLYRESLVLDKPLEIIGDGPVHAIVVEHTAVSLQMRTDAAVVRGLTLRTRSGLQAAKHFAVDIPAGRLVLEDCDVMSEALSCVAIHGVTANPLIRRCRIHHGGESGIFIYGHAGGVVEDCDISDNTLSGVVIKQDSQPIIRRCQIHDGKASGVFVYGHARGTVEDCDIFGNAQSGVAIKQGGDPLVRRCQIHDGKASGVFVYEDGAGRIQGCDIFGNALSGMAIKLGGNPTVRRCRVYRNAHHGIQVYEGGTGTVEHCELTANGRQAWYIDAVSRVRRRHNTT